MNAEKCRVLLFTLECGSITEASKRLGYTPSGISKAISSLEEETGFPLIMRTHEGVSATNECKMILPLIREMNSLNKKLDQTVASIKGLEVGTLNIGSSYNIYYRWLTEKIAEFFSDKPGIKVRAYSDVSSQLKKALDDYEIDACIMSRRDGDFDWIHLKWDQLVVLVPKNHKYIEKGIFPLKALENEPYIQIYPGNETDNSIMLKKNKINPDVRFVCADGGAAVPIVEKGMGVCIVNQIIAEGLKGEISILPIYPQQLVDIGIAIPTLKNTSPLIRQFTEYLVEHSKEIN